MKTRIPAQKTMAKQPGLQTFVVPVGDYFKSLAALDYAIKRSGPRDDILLFHVDSELPNNPTAFARPKVTSSQARGVPWE